MLLLEAYEQLEADCGKEIDKALAKEREERKALERKVCWGCGHCLGVNSGTGRRWPKDHEDAKVCRICGISSHIMVTQKMPCNVAHIAWLMASGFGFLAPH